MSLKTEETQSALDEFGRRVQREARRLLKSRKVDSTGKLSRSIKPELKAFPSGAIELSFKFPIYGAFQDEGVKGHGRGGWQPHKPKRQQAPNSRFKFKADMPPPKVFEKWIKDKPIRPRDPRTGRFMKASTSAWLMARSAGRFGLKPRRWFTDAVEKEVPKLRRDLRGAFKLDSEKFVQQLITANFS